MEMDLSQSCVWNLIKVHMVMLMLGSSGHGWRCCLSQFNTAFTEKRAPHGDNYSHLLSQVLIFHSHFLSCSLWVQREPHWQRSLGKSCIYYILSEPCRRLRVWTFCSLAYAEEHFDEITSLKQIYLFKSSYSCIEGTWIIIHQICFIFCFISHYKNRLFHSLHRISASLTQWAMGWCWYEIQKINQWELCSTRQCGAGNKYVASSHTLHLWSF